MATKTTEAFLRHKPAPTRSPIKNQQLDSTSQNVIAPFKIIRDIKKRKSERLPAHKKHVYHDSAPLLPWPTCRC